MVIAAIPVGSTGPSPVLRRPSKEPIDFIDLTRYQCTTVREKAAGPTEKLDLLRRTGLTFHVRGVSKGEAFAPDPEVDRFVSIVKRRQKGKTIRIPIKAIREISVKAGRLGVVGRCRITHEPRGDVVEGDLHSSNEMLLISGIDPTGSKQQEQLQSSLVGNVKIIEWD